MRLVVRQVHHALDVLDHAIGRDELALPEEEEDASYEEGRGGGGRGEKEQN